MQLNIELLPSSALHFPLNMNWSIKMDALHWPAELLGGVVAAVAICGTVAYIYRNRRHCCLDPENFKEFKLVKKTPLNQYAARFRFALPSSSSVLGVPAGQHVICRGADYQGKEVIGPYCPITLDSDVGYFELVVKMHPQERMSHHFRQMQEGDLLAAKGPAGRFRYTPGQVRAFGLLAGGTGITQMFQLTRAILENPRDKTIVHLIYANATLDDILLKEELDAYPSKFSERFKVYYVLEKPPPKWEYGVGYISREMIQRHCPPPAPDIQILICGPEGMNRAMADHLRALGYTPDMQFVFREKEVSVNVLHLHNVSG